MDVPDLSWDPEFALLSAVMRNFNKKLLPSGLQFDHFENPVAQTIYRAVATLVAEDKQPGPVQVSVWLKETGKLEEIGGNDMLEQVIDACGLPSSIPEFFDTLNERRIRRKVAEAGAWLEKSAARDDLSAGNLAERLLEAATVVSGASEAPVQRIGEIDHEGADQGITTGYPELDRLITTGGYPAGQMTIASATHKGGKSTFLMSSALTLAEMGYPVLYASFADLNRRQLKRRWLKMLCGWAKTPNELHLVQDYDIALDFLSRAPIDVYDASALDSGHDVRTFGAWLRANHEMKGYRAVFLDYAQELSSGSGRVDSEVSEGNDCARVIRRLGDRTGLPFIVGSQETTDRDGRTITKYSRQWEESAGWVLRIKHEDKSDVCGVDVAYSRFGPKGGVTLRWNNERLRVER